MSMTVTVPTVDDFNGVREYEDRIDATVRESARLYLAGYLSANDLADAIILAYAIAAENDV